MASLFVLLLLGLVMLARCSWWGASQPSAAPSSPSIRGSKTETKKGMAMDESDIPSTSNTHSRLSYFRKVRGSSSAGKRKAKQYYTEFERVDPFVGDNEVNEFESKRADQARQLLEQDIRRSKYESFDSASAGQDEDNRKAKFAPFGLTGFPDLALRCDPIINFKLKQKLNYFGTCVTLGVDYLSDLAHWRAYCGIEDTILRGRFSLKGSELSWAKSWMVNLGLGEESSAKFKLRLGMNLKNYQAYARLRFRAEPISMFDIGEGITCGGKVPVPKAVLPLIQKAPLRIEYRVRINTPRSDISNSAGEGDLIRGRRNIVGIGSGGQGSDRNYDMVSVSTGIDTIEVSLDELNFCLEWDEESPLWYVPISFSSFLYIILFTIVCVTYYLLNPLMNYFLFCLTNEFVGVLVS
jgi:hypothetical protein